MDTKEILRFCLEKGLLLDKEILNLFSEAGDAESVKLIIDKIQDHTHQKIITKKIFIDNRDKVSQFFLTLPEEKQKSLETLKIKLGLSIEISKQTSTPDEVYEISELNKPLEDFSRYPVKVGSATSFSNKKLETKDFVKYFRNRFSELKNILQNRSELKGLVSIDKISGDRQTISIMGLVSDKRVTKNKNILFEIEDLTGKVRVLINQNKPELYKKAEEITLDSIIGICGSGNKEIIFANDVIFPDAVVLERKKSPVEEYALFVGDLHFGSRKFLKQNFLKFIDYLGGGIKNGIDVSKVKYLFLLGDIVSGVGNYPNQEKDLEIKDLEEQFIGLAKILEKVRKDITIIVSPGNHDGVRIMEPQPFFDEKYAWPLYDLKNVVFSENPSQVNIGSRGDFSGFNVLIYHGFSFPYYANNIVSLMKAKAMNAPDKIMKYLLKNRHLAPTHTSTQYFPLEKDAHLIRDVPDIFVAGHTHKSAVTYYNNILLVSVSSWEGLTDYEEKMGAEPDFCKVPVVNLKTREVKVLDFE